MEFYLTLFGLTTIVSFMEFFNIKLKTKKYIFIGISIIYIFISGLRWNNPDWIVYYPFFMENNTLDDFWYGNIPVDKGFGLINFVVKSFTDEYTILLFALAILIISIKVNFIIKFATFPLISLLYWFGTYIGDIFFIRQTLAICITLIAFRFILKKNFILFVLFTLLAATIQISAISFLLAYFIFYRKIKVRYLVLGLIFSILIGRMMDISILLTLNNFFNVLPDSERLLEKIDFYYESGSVSDGPIIILTYIRRIIFIPIELWAISRIEKFDKNYRGYLNLIIFGYILYFLFDNMSPIIATRISSVYYIYEIITIPMIFIVFKSLKIRIGIFCLLLIYLLIKYLYAINMYYDIYVPYINVLFN
ncbi:EpsG family protein [Megamonas funiformis]|uniref:EpsG family protein n=1 Tax=Megamonas funiformis TaxID=437897 RepID=UPI0040275195